MQMMMRAMHGTLDRMTILYAQHPYDKMRKESVAVETTSVLSILYTEQ